MPDNLEILDACALLNLYASQYLEPILKSRAGEFFIVEQVRRESLFIRKSVETTSGFEYEAVILDSIFQGGLLKLVNLEAEDEIKLFVEIASHLDDGEAATIAVAIKRQMAFVTDDRKARRIFKQQNPATSCLSTLEIIKEWHEQEHNDLRLTQIALQNILQYANYKPGKNHPHFDWWNTMLQRAGWP